MFYLFEFKEFFKKKVELMEGKSRLFEGIVLPRRQ